MIFSALSFSLQWLLFQQSFSKYILYFFKVVIDLYFYQFNNRWFNCFPFSLSHIGQNRPWLTHSIFDFNNFFKSYSYPWGWLQFWRYWVPNHPFTRYKQMVVGSFSKQMSLVILKIESSYFISMPTGWVRLASLFIDQGCSPLTEYQQDVFHDYHKDKSATCYGTKLYYIIYIR